MKLDLPMKLSLYRAISKVQQSGGTVCVIGPRSTLDGITHGSEIEVGKIVFSEPENAKQAGEIVDTLIRSGAIDMLVYLRE